MFVFEYADLRCFLGTYACSTNTALTCFSSFLQANEELEQRRILRRHKEYERQEIENGKIADQERVEKEAMICFLGQTPEQKETERREKEYRSLVAVMVNARIQIQVLYAFSQYMAWFVVMSPSLLHVGQNL